MINRPRMRNYPQLNLWFCSCGWAGGVGKSMEAAFNSWVSDCQLSGMGKAVQVFLDFHRKPKPKVIPAPRRAAADSLNPYDIEESKRDRLGVWLLSEPATDQVSANGTKPWVATYQTDPGMFARLIGNDRFIQSPEELTYYPRDQWYEAALNAVRGREEQIFKANRGRGTDVQILPDGNVDLTHIVDLFKLPKGYNEPPPAGHFIRRPMSCEDYGMDTKSCFDQEVEDAFLDELNSIAKPQQPEPPIGPLGNTGTWGSRLYTREVIQEDIAHRNAQEERVRLQDGLQCFLSLDRSPKGDIHRFFRGRVARPGDVVEFVCSFVADNQLGLSMRVREH